MKKSKLFTFMLSFMVILVSAFTFIGCSDKEDTKTAADYLDGAYTKATSQKYYKAVVSEADNLASLDNAYAAAEIETYYVTNDGTTIKEQKVSGETTLSYKEYSLAGLNYICKEYAVASGSKNWFSSTVSPREFADEIANIKKFKDVYQKELQKYNDACIQDSNYAQNNSVSNLEVQKNGDTIVISYKVVEIVNFSPPNTVQKETEETTISVTIKNGVFEKVEEISKTTKEKYDGLSQVIYSAKKIEYTFASTELVNFNTSEYTEAI